MTASCPTYIAPHRNQLGLDGGKYGGFNCTAVAGAMALDQSTCGITTFTGAQIRAATNEPVPDPGSPGLNLTQVDLAIQKLCGINFDTEYDYFTTTAIARIKGGEPAIVQFQRAVLFGLGLDFGATFKGGHAAKVDGIGGSLHIDDPLTRRFAVTDDQFRKIAGSLIVEGAPIGWGKAYISFGPDSIRNYRATVRPGTFGLYTVSGRTITSAEARRTGGFSATCTPPMRFTWTGHSSQLLVVLTSGFLKGKAIRSTWAQEV